MNRRILLVAAGFVMALAILLLWQGPAHANGTTDKATCRAAPNPATPDGGMIGLLVQAPANPWNGDPFTDPSHGISEKYGYGGLEFITYDQGCPGQIQSYAPNWIENLIWRCPIYLTALAGQVMDTMMHPTFLGVFDPLMVRTAQQVHDGPFALLIPFTFACVGLYVIVMALRDRSVSRALSAGGWLLLAIGVAAVFSASPLWAAHTFDDNTRDITAAVGGGFGGADSLTGSIHRNILYKQWLAGTFGDPNGPAAQKYGAELFDAGAYSWAEWNAMQAGAVDASKIKEAKQQRWQDIADKVEHEYPIAYEHLQGTHIDTRMVRSAFSVVGVVGATLFQIVAGLAFVVAVVSVRLFILVWPIAVVIGAFPTKRHVLRNLWEWLVGGFVGAIACQAAAGLVSLFVGQILAATELAGWLVLFLMLAVFIAAWKMLQPYRSFAGGHVGSAARKVGKAAVAVKVGEEVVKRGELDANEKRGSATRPRKPPPDKPGDDRPPAPPRERRKPPTDMPTGFTRPVDPRDPQLPAYRPAVGAGRERPAIGPGRSKAWEQGGPRIRVEDPPESGLPRRQRVDSTSPSAPNPPDATSRAAKPRVRSDVGAPIDTRIRRDKEGREVYVPVARRKAKEPV